MGKQWKQRKTLFWGSPKSLQMLTEAMKLKDAWKQGPYFADKGPSSQSYGFSSGRVWMCELTIKNAECWRMDPFLNCGIGEDSLRVPWTARRSNQSTLRSWIFIGRTDAEATKSWLTGKAPDAGEDWSQEEKGATEDEMVGCHHRLNGHEFE